MTQKKQPLRKCTGCGEMKEKRELIRVVKAPDTKDENGNVTAKGEISLDLTGKKSGRGAYICHDIKCFEKRERQDGLKERFPAKSPTKFMNSLKTA